MKIEITEKTGIKHEGLSHLKFGEIREVDDKIGAFFVANGWAKDVSGRLKTGERGKLDLTDPSKFGSDKVEEPAEEILPKESKHKK